MFIVILKWLLHTNCAIDRVILTHSGVKKKKIQNLKLEHAQISHEEEV